MVSIPARNAYPVSARRGRRGTGLAVLVAAVMAAIPAPGQGEPAQAIWEAPVEVASGEAFRGPWRMNRSDFRYVDDPTVAMNDGGTIAVAWAVQSQQDIYFQRYTRDGEPQLSEPVNVSRSGDTFSWLPRMVLGEADEPEVFVLWQEIVFSGGSHGGEIFFARSEDGGRSFGEPINLSRTSAGAGKGRLSRNYWHNGSLDLVRGPDDTLYAAWTEYEGRLHVARSSDGGESFSAPLRVAGGDDALPARAPSLAVGADGTVYLAWTLGETPAADIHLARSEDGAASFTAPRAIHEGPGHADAPKLAVADDGTVHLVYAESADGPMQGYEVYYTRAADGVGFDAPRRVSAEGTAAHFPALALDGEGRPYLLWEHHPDPRGRPLGLGFSYASPDSDDLAAPSLVPGTGDVELGFNGSQQGLLMRKLAVNTHGDIAVVNSTFRENERSRVRLFRGRLADASDVGDAGLWPCNRSEGCEQTSAAARGAAMVEERNRWTTNESFASSSKPGHDSMPRSSALTSQRTAFTTTCPSGRFRAAKTCAR